MHADKTRTYFTHVGEDKIRFFRTQEYGNKRHIKASKSQSRKAKNSKVKYTHVYSEKSKLSNKPYKEQDVKVGYYLVINF